MTEKDAKMYQDRIKRMKHRHPFSWRKYENHVMIVAYLIDKIDELDNLIRVEEEPILKFNEEQGMKIVKCTGFIVQGINMWKQSPFFHTFLFRKVDDVVSDTISGSYDYVQTMLNMVVVDMNRELVKYINYVKSEILNPDEIDDEEEYDEEVDDSEVNLITSTNSKLMDDQLANIIRMRNEATTKRLIVRNAISSLRAMMSYDYLEIIRGIDIISERKRENKNIAQTLSLPEIKFIDPKSIKEGDVTK